MSARLVGVFMAGVLVGAGGLWWALPHDAPAVPEPRSEPVRPAPACPPGPSLDIAEIRAVVRQELLAAATAAPARAVSAPPTVLDLPSPPVPPEDKPPESSRPKPSGHEYADAQRLLEGSLARRTWSVEDRGQLRVLLGRLSPTERESLIRQLIVAANRGDLKVDVAGPLF